MGETENNGTQSASVDPHCHRRRNDVTFEETESGFDGIDDNDIADNCNVSIPLCCVKSVLCQMHIASWNGLCLTLKLQKGRMFVSFENLAALESLYAAHTMNFIVFGWRIQSV